MSTSHEKIGAALERAESVAEDEQQTIALRTAAAALMMFRWQLVEFLPTDPSELDALLADGARWLLALRSDDAESIELVAAGELDSLRDAAS